MQPHRRNSGGFCGQWSVLATLLWSLVVGELTGLNGNDCYTLGNADAIAVLISIRFPNTVSELHHEALSTVQQSCDRTQLSINPQRTVIVPFIRKKDLRSQTLSGHTMQLATEVR
jgi:hypothetical protein